MDPEQSFVVETVETFWIGLLFPLREDALGILRFDCLGSPA